MIKDAENKWKQGHLYLLDRLPAGDPAIVNAINTYVGYSNANKQSRQWARILTWVENFHFGLGRHYLDDLLSTKLSGDPGSLNVSEMIKRRIPRPTNDILGPYIETNVSIMTENRPIPRITPKSDSLNDKHEAMLSELVIEHLWEELDLPEKHRAIARLLQYCGMAMLETYYDPLVPRVVSIPEDEEQPTTPLSSGIQVPIKRKVPKIDPKTGAFVYTSDVEYGDIVSNVVSGFEIYLPNDHYWNKGDLNSGWIMKEQYVPVEMIKDKYLNTKVKGVVTKKNGYYRENIEKVAHTQIKNYALWWWERMSDFVDGPSSSTYGASGPENNEEYTSIKIFDRRPNNDWPNGRTIIVAGEQIIYDSPKEVGARAYDKRWPKIWHPYTLYRGEPIPGSIYGRATVTKAVPYIKRINNIDTTMIMYRRTVPMASWILPKGSSPVEQFHSGEAGSYITYDPNRTNRMEPKPVYPPPYPESVMAERQQMMKHIDDVMGTEQILRGERPIGAYSAAAMTLLRQQALASRSPIMQAWDEGLQMTGACLLRETKRHIKIDERYRQRIMLLAREKASQFSIDKFAGNALSDNVNVKIDTVSMAMFSKETKQQRAIEVIQYGPNLAGLPVQLQTKLLDDLGWPDVLSPQGDDVARARLLIQLSKDKRFDLAIPMAEDDPYVIHDLLSSDLKSEGAFNYPVDVYQHLTSLSDYYKGEIIKAEQAKLQMMQVAQGGGTLPPTGA